MMELRAVQQSLEGVGFERGTSDDYYTPPWVFDRLNMTFDCCDAVGRLEDQPTPGNPTPLGSPSR